MFNKLSSMACGSFGVSSKALVFCRPYYASTRDLPFSLRTSTIGHCGCVGAIAAPRNLVKPSKDESRDFSGARKSKDKTMPWKKLDANEFGIQRSMIPDSTRMVLNKLKKKGFQVYLVGGCVRDLILDRIPKDFDVITSAELKEVRTVSAAKLSFIEDTARILRAIRIAARLGFSLTKDVAVSVKELSSSLLRLDPSRIRMEINYMLAYGSAEASLRLLWRFGLMEILLPIQASYLVSQGFRRRDGRSNMLLSLFRNLDRLVAPDRPCHEFLWIGILAFHKAMVDEPRDPIVVGCFCLAIYSEVSLSEAIEIARSNTKQHNSNFQELSGHEKDNSDSDITLSQQVMSLAESIKSAARKMNDRNYLANAMSKYPQAPESDVVFMSKPMVERVQKMFGSVRRKGSVEREVAGLEPKINYKSLALGDFHETRRVFARIVFDTVYPPT